MAEQTYYFCQFSKGHSVDFNCGPALTVRLTDQRIFITLTAVTIFEANLSEITLMKVTPCFLGAKVEVVLQNRNGFEFSINRIKRLFESLRQLKIPHEGDEMRIKRLFMYYQLTFGGLAIAIILIVVSKFLKVF